KGEGRVRVAYCLQPITEQPLIFRLRGATARQVILSPSRKGRGKVSRAILVFLAGVIALFALIWWLPLPNELRNPPVGTLMLVDSRGSELAELASREARPPFPIALDKMGAWLPRVTVALEDRRFYEHRGIDWRATLAAS